MQLLLKSNTHNDYPKIRVIFLSISLVSSYIATISARFIRLEVFILPAAFKLPYNTIIDSNRSFVEHFIVIKIGVYSNYVT